MGALLLCNIPPTQKELQMPHFINPWANHTNFVDLGSAYNKHGQPCDLYALVPPNPQFLFDLQIGVRFSDDDPDYLSSDLFHGMRSPTDVIQLACQRLTAKKLGLKTGE